MDLMKAFKLKTMTNEALQNLISGWIPDLEFSEEGSQFLNIKVLPEHLHQLMLKLKTNNDKKFYYLFCLSGIDWDLNWVLCTI